MKALFTLLCVGLTTVVGVGELRSQQMDARDFVRQQFAEGVDYDAASRYDASDVPALVQMLRNQEEAMVWTNIVGVLGIIGNDAAVDAMLQFAAAGSGEMSLAAYSAKSSVMIALGYAANAGNDRALQYLIGSLDPTVWEGRSIGWQSPIHGSAAERNTQLSTMAIMGLALSGREEAGDALTQFGGTPAGAFRSAVGAVLSEALEAHSNIAQNGLSEYYRRPPPN